MEWVAIDVHIAGDAVTHRLADRFRLRVAEAAGLLALAFAGMAQHAQSGELAAITDSQIEEWAHWHGKRRAFAAFFREHFEAAALHFRYRRGKYRGRIPRWARELVFARDGGRCVLCGSFERPQLDHITPWSRGGSDLPSNLQVLCQPCNIQKGPRRASVGDN